MMCTQSHNRPPADRFNCVRNRIYIFYCREVDPDQILLGNTNWSSSSAPNAECDSDHVHVPINTAAVSIEIKMKIGITPCLSFRHVCHNRWRLIFHWCWITLRRYQHITCNVQTFHTYHTIHYKLHGDDDDKHILICISKQKHLYIWCWLGNI